MKLRKPFPIMLRIMLLTACWFGCAGFHWWDPLARWIGIGNEAVAENRPEVAAEAYANAADVKPGDPRIHYNKGLVKAMQDAPEDALEQFEIAAGSDDPDVKADALYNKGRLEMEAGDPASAVTSFTDSLKLQPDNLDAKANLEMALRMLQQMPSPTPQSRDGDQKENQDEDKEEKKEEEQKQQEKKEQDDTRDDRGEPTPTPTGTVSPGARSQAREDATATPTPQRTPSPQAQPRQGRTPEPVEEGKMSQSEAVRLLDAQEEEEMEVLKRFHQLPPADDRDIEKDW